MEKRKFILKKGFKNEFYFHNPFKTFMFCPFSITIDIKQRFYALTIFNFEFMRFLTLIEFYDKSDN